MQVCKIQNFILTLRRFLEEIQVLTEKVARMVEW